MAPAPLLPLLLSPCCSLLLLLLLLLVVVVVVVLVMMVISKVSVMKYWDRLVLVYQERRCILRRDSTAVDRGERVSP